eukprot:COSAG06_NODE_3413_length_5380_cov_4.609354_4_plen_50_part_00
MDETPPLPPSGPASASGRTFAQFIQGVIGTFFEFSFVFVPSLSWQMFGF